jgi:hypothetical protein
MKGATALSNYWPASTNAGNPNHAWNANLDNENVNNNNNDINININKTSDQHVRAARAGS